MGFDLVPGRFWTLPQNVTSLVDDDDWLPTQMGTNNLAISEDANHVYIEAALPGVNPQNIEVNFDKGILWIKGEVKEENQSTDESLKKKYYRKATQSFSYRIAVPGDIDLMTDPEASAKDGIMTVTFTKSPKSQPKKITVKAAK